MSGNTFNAFLFGRLRGRPKRNSSLPFELMFALWYGIFYLIVAIEAIVLRVVPVVPHFVARVLQFPGVLFMGVFSILPFAVPLLVCVHVVS
mmetsp:Transcript_27984/g.60627  ORF Transcript_27984/g.60627 Transcript_27984/m.60627 type:complete len:91 (-) Transcript_27984:24-296(-)